MGDEERLKKLLKEYEANREFAKRTNRGYDLWEKKMSDYAKKKRREDNEQK